MISSTRCAVNASNYARLAQHSLPVPVATAIGTALESLGVDPVAVRSSSTFEDLAQAAFAGQHDTYLNIRGADEVVQRVRDCYLSLWGDRAVLYRHRQGFTQHDARMAVVVQRQIACDRAGVGFSVNPVTGRVDRMAIDANYGLGESVVAGECEVDHFELDKSTLAVIDQVIGHKTRMIVPTPDGVAETQVSPDQADRACLDESQLRAVAELLKSVEAHYGWPQDIEWGFKAGKLYQFQSRPVTTVPPRWTRDESAEPLPQPDVAAQLGLHVRRVPQVAYVLAGSHGLASPSGRLVPAFRQPHIRQPERRRTARRAPPAQGPP